MCPNMSKCFVGRKGCNCKHENSTGDLVGLCSPFICIFHTRYIIVNPMRRKGRNTPCPCRLPVCFHLNVFDVLYILMYIRYTFSPDDCVQRDVWAFGIAGDWKATALEAEVWVETVKKGGLRFMAAWRKEEVDAARHRQEKREATKLGKLVSYTEAWNLRSETNWPSRRAEGTLYERETDRDLRST